MIKGLHHNAWRCRDSEETRRFYEDFLGLPLAHTLEIRQSKTGRATKALHTFFRMDDGSFLAFFEVPDQPFEFKDQHDFDLHIALEVPHDALRPMLEKGRAAGIETRGIADHGFIDSIYFRDPNGYVVELTARRPGDGAAEHAAQGEARARLDAWQSEKAGSLS
ncbi:MAG: VOC family protein [Alphaproteobacteria bacterium]